jgi:transcriptional regulator with XRE-family HTH domain
VKELPTTRRVRMIDRSRSTPLPALAAHRRKMGLTQRQLGELAGVAHTTVLQLESLSRGACPQTLRKLATALRVAPEELLNGESTERKGCTLHYWRAPYHLSPNTLPRISRDRPFMNNLKERNLVPDSVQESPEDPPGFIYPSYRTAQSVIKRVQRPLKGSHQPSAYVSSAVGGSVFTLSFEDNKNSNRLSPPRYCGGGIRDRIRGFSRESRTNLLRRLASINRRAFRAFKGRIIFVTLTYPHEYPQDPVLCKGHLKALRKRLQREYGPSPPSGDWVSRTEVHGTSICSFSWGHHSGH